MIDTKELSKSKLDILAYIFFAYAIFIALSYYNLQETRLNIDIISLIAHIFLFSVAVIIAFFIDKKHKKIAILAILISLISLFSIIVIDNYTSVSKNSFEDKLNYSLFSFVRSLYYYSLINIILIYFNKTKFISIRYLYFLFIVFNLIFLNCVVNNIIDDSIYFLIKRSIHFISYVLKPFPYFISAIFILKELKHKKNIFNIAYFIFSIFCFIYIILTMYYFKQLKEFFYHFTQINSIILILYIELILLGIILIEKKENERIKRDYIYTLREKFHDLKNEISHIYNKIDEKNKEKVEKILTKIMEINKNVSIEDDIHLTKVETKKFFSIIIDDYYYIKINIELNIKENSKIIFIDKDKTELIINNLILNAIDHLKAIDILEPISLNIYIKVKGFWLFKTKFLYIEIKNSGIIPNELNKIIYEKGFTTKDKIAYNAGIGLYHAKKLALKLGGALSHISQNGKTRFILKLPQKN